MLSWGDLKILMQILQSAMDKTHFASVGHMTRANHRFTNWLVMTLVGDNLPVMLHNHYIFAAQPSVWIVSSWSKCTCANQHPFRRKMGSCNCVENNTAYYIAEICPGNWLFVAITCLFLKPDWSHVISERVHSLFTLSSAPLARTRP